jgi:hypothetical protein
MFLLTSDGSSFLKLFPKVASMVVGALHSGWWGYRKMVTL